MPNRKRMIAVKYSNLKWSLSGAFFTATLLVNALIGQWTPHLVAKSTQESILKHCFLTACAINAEQIANHDTCRLNVTLASNLYQAYQEQTNKNPFKERERGIRAPEMFAALSLFAQEQLFENLDTESAGIIVNAPNTVIVQQVPLTCYLLAAYTIATEQEKDGNISDNLTTFLQKIKDNNQQMVDDRNILLTLDIKIKESLHNLLDIHSRQLIELYLKQRCAAAAKLVDHRNSLPL